MPDKFFRMRETIEMTLPGVLRLWDLGQRNRKRKGEKTTNAGEVRMTGDMLRVV